MSTLMLLIIPLITPRLPWSNSCSYRKTYESCYYYTDKASTKISKINVVAVGTDGEQALVKAIQVAFQGKVIQLRCFIHMKDNIRHYLTEILLPESTREDIIRDIFVINREQCI